MFRTIQRLYFANRDEQIVCSYNNNIFESLRLPLDKISCTRQFESKLSLRSFAKSLAKGSFFENLPVLPYLFSKTYPSFLTLKEGSTSHLDLLPSGKKRETAPPRRSEPLRSKVGGPSKVSPDCTGWDRMGIAVYSLQLIVYSLRLISWLFADNLQISC